MYEIYAYPNGNMSAPLLIYQPGNNRALVLAPKLTREVSRGGSLSFTMPRDHPCYDMLPKMRTVVSVLRDTKEIWRGRVLSHEADWYNRRVIYCEGALSYFNDSCITPFNYKGKLSEFLHHLLDAHNSMMADTMKQFELGTVTAALGDLVVHYGDADEYGVGEDYGSTWDILDKMVLKTYGGYFYCTFNTATRKNVLNYCDQAYEAKRQTAQDIEYGVNLIDLTEKTDTNDMFTRIFPMGNKHTVEETRWIWKFLWWGKKETTSHEERYGIMDTDTATVTKYLPAGWSCDLKYGWIQNDEAVKKFGVIAKIREFDTDSCNDTFAAAVQDLQQNYAMSISYTIKAVDLVDAGYDTERLDFAMYSHIISAPHSVDAIMLCTKLVEPLDKPDKKEFTFGMTRRTLTDRQVANLGKTNLLEENAATSEKYHQNTLDQLLNYQKKNDAAVEEAAKTATNFLSFTPEEGLVVRHESLPNKRVQITNEGVRVSDGRSMVNIASDSISITDGDGSCSISSGKITFHGIKNQDALRTWSYGAVTSFSAQTIELDLSGYSAVLLIYDTYKSGTWFSSGGTAGRLSAVLPVNGKTQSIAYPWNTPHWRSVTVYKNKIVFGSGNERTSWYSPGLINSISLESPGGDGVNTNNSVCRPCALYGFM